MWRHGTKSAYSNHKCRCDLCRAASREARGVEIDRNAMSDLLHELFPNGMTSDAPLARAHREAA